MNNKVDAEVGQNDAEKNDEGEGDFTVKKKNSSASFVKKGNAGLGVSSTELANIIKENQEK